MKKIDFDKIFSRVANIGVIAGIIFLGVELRQNTRSLEVNAYQVLMGQISELGRMQVENPEFNAVVDDLLNLSSEELEELGDVELSRPELAFLSAVFYLHLRHGDLAYYQFERGIISEERLMSVINPLRLRLCRPAYQEWYRGLPNVRSAFVEDYRDFIDSLISDCE